MKNKKKCFVIMPVSRTKSCTEAEWTGVFEHMIKPAVTGSRLGYECERAKPLTGAFIKDILEQLNSADVVIADLTDRNPNVCYELGIRHTLKNRTILIAQNILDVPSDLQSYWVITYEKDLTGVDKFKRRVREILTQMKKDPDKPDSPVADFLQLRNVVLLASEKKENLKKLSALISEISFNISTIDDLIDRVKSNKEARKAGKEVSTVSTVRFSNSCLDLLLSSSYVMYSKEFQSTIRGMSNIVVRLNNWLTLWADERFARQTEEFFEELLPELKDSWIQILGIVSMLRTVYADENYIEPAAPIICLAKQEHEQYLKFAK